MEPKWIKINTSLRSGFEIMNKVDIKKFEKFLEHIMLARSSGNIFTEDELIKLEKILKLSADEVSLLVKTTNYLMKRVCKFLIKPSSVSEELRFLNIDEDKADCVLKQWSQSLNSSIGVEKLGNIDTVTDVEWQLNIELSTNAVKKTKTPKALIKMELQNGKKDDVLLELPHEELYGFFQQLNSIQSELDNLEK